MVVREQLNMKLRDTGEMSEVLETLRVANTGGAREYLTSINESPRGSSILGALTPRSSQSPSSTF